MSTKLPRLAALAILAALATGACATPTFGPPSAVLSSPGHAPSVSPKVERQPSPSPKPSPKATHHRAKSASQAAGVVVPVTFVTDGDTFHVLYQGRDQKVRFIGVNTPEVSWYGGQGQCYGATAGDYTRSRLDGRSVRLVFDRQRRDIYGRLLAYVYLGHEFFNLTLVRLGYAEAETIPPDTRYASEFAAAADTARREDKGLWKACPGLFTG